VKDKEKVMNGLRKILTYETQEEVMAAMDFIEELDKTRESLLTAYLECGNKLRELSLEMLKKEGEFK